MPRVRQTVGQLTQSAAISAPALSGAFFCLRSAGHTLQPDSPLGCKRDTQILLDTHKCV
ncbi:hypothetical protein METHP14_10119 [Pseudomonas sp. P14-2025]